MSETVLDIKTIYNYDTHQNIPWNIVEYQPVREYLDPQKMIDDRKRQQKQSQPVRYVTRRGNFLDQHIKYIKDFPASCTYEAASTFDQTLNKKQSKKHKIDFKLRKNSYLQQIQSKAKRFKSPAIGQYHIQGGSHKQLHSSKKKLLIGQKRYFYQDSQFLSTTVPGSANYFPHDIIPSTKQQRTNHKMMIQKHHKQKQRDRKRSLKQTDPGTYRPLAASFNTFDKLKIDDEKRKKKIEKKKPSQGFGSSDAKFEYQRTAKSKGDIRPDPCHYNTMIEWKGKGQDAKKNNWVRCLSARQSRSVYH